MNANFVKESSERRVCHRPGISYLALPLREPGCKIFFLPFFTRLPLKNFCLRVAGRSLSQILLFELQSLTVFSKLHANGSQGQRPRSSLSRSFSRLECVNLFTPFTRSSLRSCIYFFSSLPRCQTDPPFSALSRLVVFRPSPPTFITGA